VTNRPYVHVGLAALEFLFCHEGSSLCATRNQTPIYEIWC
jgi:hypothetical protein